MKIFSVQDTPAVADGYTRYYFDIKTEAVEELVTAVCDTYFGGYEAEILDHTSKKKIVNPKQPIDYLRDHIISHLSAIWSDWKRQQLSKVNTQTVDRNMFS